MRQKVAAVIALMFCTMVFLLIYFDNRSTLRPIHGALRKSSQGDAPEAWFREHHEKSAPSRITYLSQGDINLGALYNILSPEVFCPYAIRIGSLDDGGKFVCSPSRMPRHCSDELGVVLSRADLSGSASGLPSKAYCWKRDTDRSAVSSNVIYGIKRSIYSVGIASEITFDEAIQEFNNYTCRIVGYVKENISSSILSRYTRINGKLEQLEIAITTDPINNRYTLGDLVEQNNDKSVEFLKMDIEGGEHHFLIPFLERYKVCQIFVEIHDTAFNQISLLSRIAKLDYALFFREINAHAPTVCEYSFIHLDCMQAYGAYMLKRYLNSVTVPT